MAMMIGHNDYLLTAIFIYLPPKSLIRFQLVCKHWLSLISGDYLSHQHTFHHRHRPKPEHSLLFHYYSVNISRYFYPHSNGKLVPYHFPPSLIEHSVVSFSNGLFLLMRLNVKNSLEQCHIYNPTTKQSRKIVLNVNKRYKFVVGLNLAFNPSNSPHYKVVCVRSTRRSPISFLNCWRFCLVEVYESETHAWRIIGEPFWVPGGLDLNHSVYLNGCVHWPGMFFNLNDGIVSDHPKIDVPGDDMFENFIDYYVESCGYLHYLAHFPRRNSLVVLKLENNFSEWTLKYHVDLNGPSGLTSVLGFVGGEGEEDDSLLLHEPGIVMAYEFKEKKSKVLADYRGEAFYEGCCVQFASFRFVDTLARV